MMIKRYGFIDVNQWTIIISDYTDKNSNNSDSIPVYFDAAFSRKVVKEKVVEGGYTMIEELVTKDVLVPEIKTAAFVYDPTTFSQEKGYEEINNYLKSRGDEITVYKGKCECSYDSEHQSITTSFLQKEKII